jgi:hypothetical protein
MMFHMSMSMCIVLVGALVFVVGGFEEDRATRGPGKRPDGISRCMPAGPRSHGACVGHGTSDIEIRVVSRLTVVGPCLTPMGSWVALARVPPSSRKRGTLFVQVACTSAS